MTQSVLQERMISADCGLGEEILIRVPRGIRSQLVFRQTRNRPFDVTATDGVAISRVGPWAYRKYFWKFAAMRGLKHAVKGWLKLFTARRALFCATLGGTLAHYTWATRGRSRYYWIENEAAVIGPIWTAPELRGRNVAVAALQAAVNALLVQGTTVFYIDTSPANESCLRVIRKCGFSGPVAVFLRPDTL